MDKNAKYGIIYTDFLLPEVRVRSLFREERAPGRSKPTITMDIGRAGSRLRRRFGGISVSEQNYSSHASGGERRPRSAAAPASGPEMGPAARKRGAAGAEWRCG